MMRFTNVPAPFTDRERNRTLLKDCNNGRYQQIEIPHWGGSPLYNYPQRWFIVVDLERTRALEFFVFLDGIPSDYTPPTAKEFI